MSLDDFKEELASIGPAIGGPPGQYISSEAQYRSGVTVEKLANGFFVTVTRLNPEYDRALAEAKERAGENERARTAVIDAGAEDVMDGMLALMRLIRSHDGDDTAENWKDSGEDREKVKRLLAFYTTALRGSQHVAVRMPDRVVVESLVFPDTDDGRAKMAELVRSF